MYTYYPRAGTHDRAFMRQALLHRQNQIESINSSLKNLGLAGRGLMRAPWAGDNESMWLLSAGLLSLTARRVAHETGLYDMALAEAVGLHLLDPLSKQRTSAGPDQ